MQKGRKRLSDILANGDRTSLQKAWQESQTAEDFAPLPAGDYAARIIAGELFTSKEKATLGYKLTFEIAEGDYQGRHVWHDNWLTPAAMPMAKRDLGKIGITDLEQLDNPLPAVFLCKLRVALRRDDDGNHYNRVRAFDVTGIEEDPFSPNGEKGSQEQ